MEKYPDSYANFGQFSRRMGDLDREQGIQAPRKNS
jgi:hypothetical protein